MCIKCSTSWHLPLCLSKVCPLQCHWQLQTVELSTVAAHCKVQTVIGRNQSFNECIYYSLYHLSHMSYHLDFIYCIIKWKYFFLYLKLNLAVQWLLGMFKISIAQFILYTSLQRVKGHFLSEVIQEVLLALFCFLPMTLENSSAIVYLNYQSVWCVSVVGFAVAYW